MKLLPKPRGKVSRKPIVGTEEELKNRYHYTEVEYKKGYFKRLFYNDYSKKLIRENPGIIKAIDFLSKNKYKQRFVDSKDRFEILKVTDFIVAKGPKNRGSYTTNGFVIQLHNTKKQLFYVKQSNYAVLINEFITLNSIDKYAKAEGINIIKPHLVTNMYNSKNYIVYDFTNKLTVLDAYESKKINDKELDLIGNKLDNLQSKILLNYNIHIHKAEITPRNCFIDLSVKPYKLYLFDLVVTGIGSTKSIDELKNKLINK